jgi:GNAT superfamily N-acetyltransferase
MFPPLHVPSGLSVTQLASDNHALAKDCRCFCLRAIRDTYGYDYTPEWHADLDSLGEGDRSHYAACNRGAFFVFRDPDGRIAGTAGVRAMTNNPRIATVFAHRYPDIERVAFNCRLYVAPAWRKQGLGHILTALRAEAARGMDYATVYMHCDAKAERLRQYWLDLGFQLIEAVGEVAHYDKPL